jgi:hypothetical protein
MHMHIHDHRCLHGSHKTFQQCMYMHAQTWHVHACSCMPEHTRAHCLQGIFQASASWDAPNSPEEQRHGSRYVALLLPQIYVHVPRCFGKSFLEFVFTLMHVDVYRCIGSMMRGCVHTPSIRALPSHAYTLPPSVRYPRKQQDMCTCAHSRSHIESHRSAHTQ